MCPYFDSEYKRCVLYETYQDGYQREAICLSSGQWRDCANYTHSSDEDKVNKRLR